MIGSGIMGKQGSPRSPRPESQDGGSGLGMKVYKIRCSDPRSWRRMSGLDCRWNSKTLLLHGLKSDASKYSSCRGLYAGKKHLWLQKNIRTIALMFGLLGCLFLLDYLMVSFHNFGKFQPPRIASNSSSRFQVQHATSHVLLTLSSN